MAALLFPTDIWKLIVQQLHGAYEALGKLTIVSRTHRLPLWPWLDYVSYPRLSSKIFAQTRPKMVSFFNSEEKHQRPSPTPDASRLRILDYSLPLNWSQAINYSVTITHPSMSLPPLLGPALALLIVSVDLSDAFDDFFYLIAKSCPNLEILLCRNCHFKGETRYYQREPIASAISTHAPLLPKLSVLEVSYPYTFDHAAFQALQILIVARAKSFSWETLPAVPAILERSNMSLIILSNVFSRDCTEDRVLKVLEKFGAHLNGVPLPPLAQEWFGIATIGRPALCYYAEHSAGLSVANVQRMKVLMLHGANGLLQGVYVMRRKQRNNSAYKFADERVSIFHSLIGKRGTIDAYFELLDFQLECLKSRGEKVDLTTALSKRSKTILHLLAASVSPSAAALILRYSKSYGQDVNRRTNKGRTPLHVAQTEEAATALLSLGADLCAVDSYGRTPLENATRPPFRWGATGYLALIKARPDLAGNSVHSFVLALYQYRSTPQILNMVTTTLREKFSSEHVDDLLGRAVAYLPTFTSKPNFVASYLNFQNYLNAEPGEPTADGPFHLKPRIVSSAWYSYLRTKGYSAWTPSPTTGQPPIFSWVAHKNPLWIRAFREAIGGHQTTAWTTRNRKGRTLLMEAAKSLNWKAAKRVLSRWNALVHQKKLTVEELVELVEATDVAGRTAAEIADLTKKTAPHLCYRRKEIWNKLIPPRIDAILSKKKESKQSQHSFE